MKIIYLYTLLILLSSCKIDDCFQQAKENKTYEKHVIAFDSNLVLDYMNGNFDDSNSLRVMETNSQQLKESTRNHSVWIKALNPGCSRMYGSDGIIDEINQIADTSGKPILILSIHYQTELLMQVRDSLDFYTPFLVVSNADYGKKNNVFKRGWQHLFEELIGKKYPKDCNQLLLRANGSCGCLTYAGEFKEIE